MRRHLVCESMLSMLVGLSMLGSAMAQEDLDFVTGTRVATEFLHSITDPARTQFRVGIVNVEASVGIRVTPQGVDPVAELVRGSNGMLRFAASRQLASKGTEPFQFAVARTTVNSETCPELRDSVETFYAALDQALSIQVSLSTLPEPQSRERFVVDGTYFSIQLWTGSGDLLISPNRNVDVELHDASYDLVGLVARCALELEGSLEQHTFR